MDCPFQIIWTESPVLHKVLFNQVNLLFTNLMPHHQEHTFITRMLLISLIRDFMVLWLLNRKKKKEVMTKNIPFCLKAGQQWMVQVSASRIVDQRDVAQPSTNRSSETEADNQGRENL